VFSVKYFLSKLNLRIEYIHFTCQLWLPVHNVMAIWYSGAFKKQCGPNWRQKNFKHIYIRILGKIILCS